MLEITNSALNTRSGYRPEIEGLRAVAALLVAIYHIWLGRVSGGVDVFFVVSAFLITRSLLGQIDRNGRIQFVTFWGGLARRLLPSAMLVLFTVVIASFLWLPRPLWEDSIRQIVASALYVENWQLALNAVDYLAQGQAASPVQHYWALAVQGQFYLIWPLLMTLTLILARRSGADFRRTAVPVFGAVFVLSLAFSIVATRSNQAFTYFNTFARLWEFALGALLALAPAAALDRRLRIPVGWIGLIGIVSCGLIFQVSRVFPGYAALWPVGCAALIILAGNSGSRAGVDRLLSLRPMVYLGGISYGIYLWHWPVLVFFRWLTHHSTISIVEGLGILGGSIVLAALSTHLLEKPVRSARPGVERGASVTRFVAVCSLPAVVLIGSWAGYFAWQKQHDERVVSTDHPDYPGARILEPGYQYTGLEEVVPRPGMLAIRDDSPAIYYDGCYRPDAHWQRENCIYGDKSATRVIALVGGSHSAHWLPALDRLARENHWRIVVYTKSNCLFSEPVEPIVLDKWCQEWNADTLEILLKDRPDLVFTTSTRGSGQDEHVPAGFLQRWEKLTASGISVAAVRDTPWMKFWVPECMEIAGIGAERCGQPRTHMLSVEDPISKLSSKPADVHFLDMSDYFCVEDHCPPVIGNIIVYRDDSHITASYARSLAPMLWQRLSGPLRAAME